MRVPWGRLPRSEDQMEAWVLKLHQDRVLAGETSPSGPCPDERFLQDLARRSRGIRLSDPRVDHAATCPRCMNRLTAFRRERRKRRLAPATALASGLLFVLAFTLTLVQFKRSVRHKNENRVAEARTVNLSDAGTFRGDQPGHLHSVSLPARIVSLSVILPRFGASGRYSVAVTRDQAGNGMVAEGHAVSETEGSQERLSLVLDLRRARPGQYFLATTHEQDQAAYYYPLEIK